MRPAEIRAVTRKQAKRFGVDIPDHLPLPDFSSVVKTEREVQDRLLGVHAIVAIAFGVAPTIVWEWLAREGLVEGLPASESELVWAKRKPTRSDRVAIEPLWALGWSLSLFDGIDFAQHSTAEVIMPRLPRTKESEPAGPFRSAWKLRSTEELVREADLAFLLHWSMVEDELNGRPYNLLYVNPYIVTERRRTFEWILSDAAWDDVPLDT